MESWKNSLPSWSVAAFGALFVYYKYSTWHFGTFKQMGIKGPRPIPVIGTLMPMMREGVMKYDSELKSKYGSIVGTFTGRLPVLMIYDVDILKQILVKDFSNFTNRFDAGVNEYPVNKMLPVLKDDRWKYVRNHISPTFSSGKLRKMNDRMLRCVETLLQNLEKKGETKETFDFRQLCGAFAMDAIASTAFGLQIDSHNDPNNQFVRMANKFFNFNLTSLSTLLIFFFPFLIKPLAKLGFSVFPKDALRFFMSVVNQAISERQEAESENVDFLQLMINAEVEDEVQSKGVMTNGTNNSVEETGTKRKGLSHEEILAQSILFFLGGYETTANALSLFGYSLAVNPDVQERLFAEIDEVMKDHEHVTYDVLKKMPYLDMCFCEVMRLYPGAPRSDRVAKEDININGLFIPKGTVIGIPILALQHDPDLWPNPEKFDPERFLPEAKEVRDQCSYLPFGIGPRNCVGMRLAITEVKMAMACILQKFKFLTCEETQIPLKLHAFKMQGVNGIKIKIEKR